MHDDRAEFERRKLENCLALGRDQSVFKQVTDGLMALDAYNYPYLWSWLGVPIIQLPADIVATQEVIWATQPDVIIETGVARGGSMIFLASMMQLLGRGKVIGVDIDIRNHNRLAIENHALSHRIELIEGSSTDDETVRAVQSRIEPGAKIMVILDSNHAREHVLAELRLYAPLVSKGQYLVVADTLLGFLTPEQTPTKRSALWQAGNEPLSALSDYLRETDRFEADEALNGKLVMSSSPGGYLVCSKD